MLSSVSEPTEMIILPDLMSMGTSWVRVGFHLDKFNSNRVECNRVPVFGSYSFYHLVVLDVVSHNLRQFKNGPNLPEPPWELGLEMWTQTTGSGGGQIKQIAMEPNNDVVDM